MSASSESQVGPHKKTNGWGAFVIWVSGTILVMGGAFCCAEHGGRGRDSGYLARKPAFLCF